MSKNEVIHMDAEDWVDEAIDTLEFAGVCINKLWSEVSRLREENKQLRAALEKKS